MSSINDDDFTVHITPHSHLSLLSQFKAAWMCALHNLLVGETSEYQIPWDQMLVDVRVFLRSLVDDYSGLSFLFFFLSSYYVNLMSGQVGFGEESEQSSDDGGCKTDIRDPRHPNLKLEKTQKGLRSLEVKGSQYHKIHDVAEL